MQTFPPSDAKWQISKEGGTEPKWRHDGRELYFLFLGDTTGRGPSATVTDPIDTAAIDSQLSNYAWSSIASDSRWFVLRRANGKDLRDTAFASGSPFPVFAAHTLNVSALRTPENLIDGGFAHNRPLEAARVLGASKVLVINSSPLGAGPAGAHCRLIVRVGDLACCERVRQRSLVMDEAARRADEIGMRLHQRILRRADHPARLVRQRAVHRHHVGAA